MCCNFQIWLFSIRSSCVHKKHLQDRVWKLAITEHQKAINPWEPKPGPPVELLVLYYSELEPPGDQQLLILEDTEFLNLNYVQTQVFNGKR